MCFAWKAFSCPVIFFPVPVTAFHSLGQVPISFLQLATAKVRLGPPTGSLRLYGLATGAGVAPRSFAGRNIDDDDDTINARFSRSISNQLIDFKPQFAHAIDF